MKYIGELGDYFPKVRIVDKFTGGSLNFATFMLVSLLQNTFALEISRKIGSKKVIGNSHFTFITDWSLDDIELVNNSKNVFLFFNSHLQIDDFKKTNQNMKDICVVFTSKKLRNEFEDQFKEFPTALLEFRDFLPSGEFIRTISANVKNQIGVFLNLEELNYVKMFAKSINAHLSVNSKIKFLIYFTGSEGLKEDLISAINPEIQRHISFRKLSGPESLISLLRDCEISVLYSNYFPDAVIDLFKSAGKLIGSEFLTLIAASQEFDGCEVENKTSSIINIDRHTSKTMLFSKSLKEPECAIIIPSDAGFFSVFNTLISTRLHWTSPSGFKELIPDWDINSIMKFWKTSKMQSYCYSGLNEGNVFFKLFDSEEFLNQACAEELIADKSLLRLHTPNLSVDPDLTYIYADRLYRSSRFGQWRQKMHDSLKDLEPNREIKNAIDSLLATEQNSILIGMHVRHPSHAMEQPNSSIPLAADFIRVALELIQDLQVNHPGVKCKIVLATDQDLVARKFTSEFSSNLLHFGDVIRVSEEDSKTFDQLEDADKNKEGFQVQHIAASNTQKWNSRFAFEVIRDAWTLAKCNYLLHAVSNVATAVSFINPEIKMIQVQSGDTLSKIKLRNDVRSLSKVL
jgi:hypothetical protein